MKNVLPELSNAEKREIESCFRYYERLGEKRRTRLMLRYRRLEGLKRLLKNPLYLLPILLVAVAFIVIRVAISLLYAVVLEIEVVQIGVNILAAVVASIINSAEGGELAYIAETLKQWNIGAFLLNSFLIIMFVITLWRRLLPWLGIPKIIERNLADLEENLAVALGLSHKNRGFFNRPFIIAYEIVAGSIEKYVIWTGVSIDTWNKPEIKAQVAHVLGGTCVEEFTRKSSKTTASARKRKRDFEIIVGHIAPGSPTKRGGLVEAI